MSILVWQYGALRPDPDSERLIREQLRLGSEYRDGLVSIELRRRREVDAVLAEDGDVAACMAEEHRLSEALDAARAEVKRERRRERTRVPVGDQRREQISLLRSQLRDARKALRAARKAARESADLRAIQKRWSISSGSELRQLRADYSDAGLRHGTYTLAEQEVRQGSTGGEPPRRRRWHGEGAIRAQLQPPIAPNALTTDLRVRLVVTGDRSAEAYLRVGSAGTGNREPVWARLPVIVHRPIPADAEIMWGVIRRRLVAERPVYAFQLVLRLQVPLHTPADHGTVAVDVGWRLMPDGAIRVGYCWDGERGWPIEVPRRIVRALRQVDDLQSIRDRDRQEAHELVYHTLAGQPEGYRSQHIPEWFRKECASIRRWKSRRRLAHLVLRWRDEQYPGQRRWKDEPIGEGGELLRALLVWREQEEHLYQWQEHQRDQALRSRLDHYRCVAAELRRCYHIVVLETACVRDLARHLEVEDERERVQAQQRQRQQVAESQLRAVLQSCGMAVVVVPHEGTTATCHVCGATAQGGPELMLRCPSGHVWDQDENAARNLLERSGRAEEPGSAREATGTARRARAGYGWGAESRRRRAERSKRGGSEPRDDGD